MNLFSQAEHEKIVIKVSENPTIWDPRRRDYRLTPTRDRIFMAIGSELGGRSGSDVSKCWVALREKYRRENEARNPLKKASGSSTASQKRKDEWPLFEKMLFLKNVISLKRNVTETVYPTNNRGSKVQILEHKILEQPFVVSVNNEKQASLEEDFQPIEAFQSAGSFDKQGINPVQDVADLVVPEPSTDIETQGTSDMGFSKDSRNTNDDKFPASRGKKKSVESQHQVEKEKFLSIVNKAIEKKKTPASTIADHISSRLENMSFEKQKKAFILLLELLNKIEDDEL